MLQGNPLEEKPWKYRVAVLKRQQGRAAKSNCAVLAYSTAHKAVAEFLFYGTQRSTGVVRRRIRSMEMTLAVVFLARCAAAHHALQKGRLPGVGSCA